MASPNYPQYPPVGQPIPPGIDPELERVFALQKGEKPWFVSLYENLKERFNPPQLPPLQVTSRPMTQEELLASDDPMLRRVAELELVKEGGLFTSLKRNIKELISPTPLPPLQVTSRPMSEEELLQDPNSAWARMKELREASLPWYKTFYRNLHETLFPPKLPPLELTSRPVQVKELFGKDEYAGRSRLISIGVHVGLVVLAFTLGTNKHVQNAIAKNIQVFAPDLAPYQPQMKVKQDAMGGGGGGGNRAPTPVSQGKLPKPALKQFTPPQIVDHQPKLAMEPTIIAPPDVQLPNSNVPQWGDPLARMNMPSNGPGSGGGMGSGSGGGVGSGRGGGFGPGEGGGVGGGAFKIGGGVSAPVILVKVEPEYSEEARKAKFQGTVLLAIVVDTEGRPQNIRVLRALGMGLDEKAIEAVQKWRFRPGYKDGKPVNVIANVEVNFRLL